MEISYGGEADLHQHLKDCKKNPGHVKFIPVDRFDVHDLPLEYRDIELVEFVKVMSDLTVRVSVKYGSDRRPKTWPDCDIPYPHYSGSCRKSMRFGTGWVMDVHKHDKLCTCWQCCLPSSPSRPYAVISLRTAAHVVFDETEGEHTTCHLFFDRGGTPERCSGVVTLKGMSSVESDIKCDYSLMKNVTYDMDLSDRLKEMIKKYESFRNKWSLSWEKGTSPNLDSVHNLKEQLVAIVSHPHGCSKQVTVGHCCRRVAMDGFHSQLIYSTPTCPGSSGAHIFMHDFKMGQCQQAHGGKCSGKKQLNYSVYGWEPNYVCRPGHTLPRQQQKCQLCPGKQTYGTVVVCMQKCILGCMYT